MPKGLKWLERAYPLKRKQMAKTEGMNMEQRSIEQMKNTVDKVVESLEMEIESTSTQVSGDKIAYDLELRTGYGWRALRTRVTLEANGKTRIWATSYSPYHIEEEKEREEREDSEIEIKCKDPVKGIADAVRYALVDHVTPELKRILEERARMKSPTEGLMEIKRDAQKLLDRIDEQMRR